MAIAVPVFAASAQNLMHRYAEPALLQRNESLADVDVVEQLVYDYGTGSVSPVSKLPQFTLVALAMLAPPVITDFESQNRSVPFPVIWVIGFVPAPHCDCGQVGHDQTTVTAPCNA